ncbi:hypothetical protein [Hydrococcus rivularis]|uniref:hypothetical protein n=1 Tax=Hydrococcus rivularis TaxID=1616834 RepID=UPI000307CB52|nr:hypothetical protein [Hydrococcus rivularis]
MRSAIALSGALPIAPWAAPLGASPTVGGYAIAPIRADNSSESAIINLPVYTVKSILSSLICY